VSLLGSCPPDGPSWNRKLPGPSSFARRCWGAEEYSYNNGSQRQSCSPKTLSLIAEPAIFPFLFPFDPHAGQPPVSSPALPSPSNPSLRLCIPHLDLDEWAMLCVFGSFTTGFPSSSVCRLHISSNRTTLRCAVPLL
jgi:hypothetical protein